MRQQRVVCTLALLLATVSGGRAANAQQYHPTAVQPLQLSAFGGVSGVFTGLTGGKNFSVTAGIDLALPPYRRIRPGIEVRGTYPTDRGLVDNQRSLLGGLRLDYPLGYRWHPYGDVLFGRGQMDYTPYGFLYQNFVYDLTTTYVYSGGGGFDYDVGERISVKVDGQIQRWGSTPTPSGYIYSKSGTVGIVYRFNFNPRSGR